MKSDETHLGEPKLRAEFRGGPLHGWIAYFETAHPEYQPIVPIHDASGKVLKRQVLTYKLAAHGPPLQYHYTSARDWDGRSA